jgi:hypothetical protein
MSISDANPIQFWLTSEQSFNEKSVSGIYAACFAQPFHCTDTLQLQLTDTDISKYYDLKAYSTTGSLLYSTSFNRSLRYGDLSGTPFYDFTIFDLTVSLSTISPSVCNTQIQFKIFDATSGLEVAHSDGIDLTDYDTDSTVLMEYSNSSSIAGLHFSEASPTPPNFYLRVPAVFFFENYPQEQEDLELSNDTIVTLWSKTEIVRTMEFGFMPDYMHKKISLITQMDTLIIDMKYWRRREGYQISQGSSKRYPLRKSTMNLVQQDFINRNVL